MLHPLLLSFQQLGARAVAGAASLAAGTLSPYIQSQHFSSLVGTSSKLTEQLRAEQLSLLQRCLRAHGILDVSHWEQPRFTKYASEEYVRSNVEPKLAALEAHGLQPQHLERPLRGSGRYHMFSCTLDTFTTNLEDLAEVMSVYQPERTSRSRSKVDMSGLSTVGQLIARKPEHMLFYLTSSPGFLVTMRQWFRDELQVTGAQFARLVWLDPNLVTQVMGSHVLELLGYLDELKAEPGWGRSLLLQTAAVAYTKLETVRGSVGVLHGLGLSRHDILELFRKQPAFLSCDFAGPVYQQKFAWIREESLWRLSTLLQSPGYLGASLKKMASRLAFIRQNGLPDPKTPSLICTASVGEFCRVVSRDIGREVTVAQFNAWVEEEWLPSAQGQRWGKPPSRQQRTKG